MSLNTRSWESLSLVSVAVVLVSLACAGCSVESNATAQTPRRASTTVSPAKGASVTVHFERSALGVAKDLPIPISSGNHNGAEMTLSGRFVRMDSDWVVLTSVSKGELWVARANILYMRVAAP